MAPSSSTGSGSRRPASGSSPVQQYFMVILLLFGVLTLLMNSQHSIASVTQEALIESFKRKHFSHREKKGNAKNEEESGQTTSNEEEESEPKEMKQQEQHEQSKKKDTRPDMTERKQELKDGETILKDGHVLAGLNCDAFGGPSREIAHEMVYWEDIPSDEHYVSPFHSKDRKQYMTFEKDQGGWNNIRMAMETVLAMAVATGRTLVLPPEQGMYLLSKSDNKQRKHFSFADFFHFETIAKEHDGLDIIHMKEFLEDVAMTGQLKNPDTGLPEFPPENRTDWDGRDNKKLYQYLRRVTFWPWWDPEDCVAAFPSDPKHIYKMRHMKEEIEKSGGFKSYEAYVGKPSPVDSPPEVRLKENWADRKDVCLYNETLQNAPVIHFGYDHQGPGARLLVHWYAFLFFQDWRHDLWMKRFVRDHVRYIDEIQCAAARVVHALRERSKARGMGSDFDTFHIRRGDFQYTVTRFEADKIYRVSEKELTPNATVYIATDERNKTFFKPLADHYDVVFLDDFIGLLEGVNTNYFGMIDQLIASRGRVFFGCWFSTFTGYINRLRGYHADEEEKTGYEDGLVPDTYYYALEDRKYHMQTFYPVKKSFYAREFPTSWRGIDKGVDELAYSVK